MKEKLLENFSKVMRTLRGLEENIHTVALISAENPCGKDVTKQDNNKRTEAMAEFLRKSNFSYRRIAGKYGNHENSFIINNITRKDTIVIGQMFQQHSVIYGVKTDNGMTFELIVTNLCEDGEAIGDVLGVRKVYTHVSKDVDDDYSEVKGRRFIIPFYDSGRYEASDWSNGKIEDIKMMEQDERRLNSYLKSSLNEGKTQKYRWEMRGLISNLLRKYN